MRKLPLSLLFLLTVDSTYAQNGAANAAPSGFFNQWMAHTSATQAKQPAWAVPLVTTYTGLIQVVRTDIVRQIVPGLAFGGGMQIATSHFHTYDHALVLRER